MIDTPAILQSELDAFNLTQIIKEPTLYNPKSLTMGTLIDVILTNVCNGFTVKRPPLITVKCSLKHFSEKTFLIDLARVSWKDIDLILSVEDAWLLCKSAFLTILPHLKNVQLRTEIALGSPQT
jgi:hypothetical protein